MGSIIKKIVSDLSNLTLILKYYITQVIFSIFGALFVEN